MYFSHQQFVHKNGCVVSVLEIEKIVLPTLSVCWLVGWFDSVTFGGKWPDTDKDHTRTNNDKNIHNDDDDDDHDAALLGSIAMVGYPLDGDSCMESIRH